LAVFEGAGCVAFDINGTLVDGVYRRWEWVIEVGLGLRRRVDGPGLRWYEVQTGRLSFEEAVSASYVVSGEEEWETGSIREEAFRVYLEGLRLREGCLGLLEALQGRFDLVVCSDTSGVTKVIAREFGLDKYFTRFYYSIDVGWLKSDRNFWHAFLAGYPGRRPEEFVMVGDNPRCDVHWPRVLGLGTIQVETTELLSEESLIIRDEFDRPDLRVTSLDEVARALLVL
jgi:FMN phosphatase YigB (HAD superfamily)